MFNLTFWDFILLVSLNTAIAYLVAYITSHAKRSAEISVEEESKDKEYIKNKVRLAVDEARKELTNLRTHNFEVQTGRRRLARMNDLVERLSLADKALGTLFWDIVNVPSALAFLKAGIQTELGAAGARYYQTMFNSYIGKIEKALARCNELEKDPFSTGNTSV